jgi:hypothetical protein
MWLLDSEDHVVSTDLEDHIDWLLGQVERVAHTLLPYLQSVEAEKDLYCIVELEGNGGASFPSSLLQRIAALDLALGVTIHSLDGEDEDDEKREAVENS